MKLLDRLSTCPVCGHRIADPDCACPREDCACGKEDGGNR